MHYRFQKAGPFVLAEGIHSSSASSESLPIRLEA